jgi:hypothetical protein
VTNIAKYVESNNNVRPERRGRKRLNPKYNEYKEKVKEHISKYRCKSGHYSRRDSNNRRYLPSNLNITKMHNTFLQENPSAEAKYLFYYNVFVTHFNLGFGSVRKDICSFCTKYKCLIHIETDQQKRKSLICELMVHKFRAKKFYQLLNETNEDTVTICFDLMQNQELPKSPIIEAYYSRQLWQYFLGIVIHKGLNSKQSHEEVYFYTWGEYQEGRGSNVIGSAVYNFLKNFVENNNFNNIRLVSDSCGGQNKNKAMLSMINTFACKHKINIEWIFPVHGHSYMPPDRAFGRVEQILKKIETIIQPQEYFEVFKTVGQLREIGIDWKVYDWKSLALKILKVKQTFKISEVKRMLITPHKQIKVLMNTYSGSYTNHSILKRGQKFLPLKIAELPFKSHVKNVKLCDIKKLIANIGINENHEAFNFYKIVEEMSSFGVIESGDEEQ